MRSRCGGRRWPPDWNVNLRAPPCDLRTICARSRRDLGLGPGVDGHVDLVRVGVGLGVRVSVGFRAGFRVGWGRCTKLGSDWSTAVRVCFIARMSSAWVRARIKARIKARTRARMRAKEGARARRRVGLRVRVRTGEEGCHREHAREP